MRLRPLNRLRLSTGVRLTLGFTVIFTAGYILLLYLASYLLSNSLQQKDQTLILAKITRYLEIDEKSGPDRLLKQIQTDGEENSKLGLLVQVTGTDGQTKLITTPYNWSGLNTKLDDWTIIPREGLWFSLVKGGSDIENELFLTSRILSNDYVLQIGRSTLEIDSSVSNFQGIIYRFMAPIFILSILFGILLAWHSLRPIRDLIKTVKQIRIGDMEARVPVRNPNSELGELSDLFNAMLEKINALIKSMKESLDNVAHDLRTPLSRMKANLELALSSEKSSEEKEETLVTCVENVEQINTMLNALLDITKAESGLLALKNSRVDIRSVVEEVISLYDLVAEDKEIEIETHLEDELLVSADEGRLRQVFANLTDNAIKYSPPKSRTRIVGFSDSTMVVVEVRDQGIGIDTNECELIFDRLYRSDKSRSQKGLGLGLSIVKAIIEAHNGTLEVDSKLGQGSIFRVKLPRLC